MFPIPTPSNILSSIAVWSDPFLQNYLPMIYFIIGTLLAGMLVYFVGDIVVSAIGKLFHKEDEYEYKPSLEVRESSWLRIE